MFTQARRDDKTTKAFRQLLRSLGAVHTETKLMTKTMKSNKRIREFETKSGKLLFVSKAHCSIDVKLNASDKLKNYQRESLLN